MTEPYISEAHLNERVAELGSQLAARLPGARDPVLVGILKGSTMFLADLVRRLPLSVDVDFMAISAYAPQSGAARIVKDLDVDLRDRDVVLVEDIVDTGLTLHYLRRTLGQRGPRSLITVSLLDRAVRRIVPVELELSGFVIPDVYLVGYGLDWQGRYRNLPHLVSLGSPANPAPLPDPWS